MKGKGKGREGRKAGRLGRWQVGRLAGGKDKETGERGRKG